MVRANAETRRCNERETGLAKKATWLAGTAWPSFQKRSRSEITAAQRRQIGQTEMKGSSLRMVACNLRAGTVPSSHLASVDQSPPTFVVVRSNHAWSKAMLKAVMLVANSFMMAV